MELCRNCELDNAVVHNEKGGNIYISKQGATKGAEMASFNWARVATEVHDYCECAWVNTFNERGIVAALQHLAYTHDLTINSIDDVDPDVWDSIVEKYDTGTVNKFA